MHNSRQPIVVANERNRSFPYYASEKPTTAPSKFHFHLAENAGKQAFGSLRTNNSRFTFGLRISTDIRARARSKLSISITVTNMRNCRRRGDKFSERDAITYFPLAFRNAIGKREANVLRDDRRVSEHPAKPRWTVMQEAPFGASDPAGSTGVNCNREPSRQLHRVETSWVSAKNRRKMGGLLPFEY